jgi:hypothetical protein
MMIAAALLCSAFLTGSGVAAAARPPATARGAASSGTWSAAKEVPGTAALNVAGRAGVSSVSCAAAGDCGAGGSYASGGSLRGARITQAFVVSQTNGTWGTAEEVSGTAALNAGGIAGVDSVSCSAASDCSAGGHYTDASGRQQMFVVSETNGAWGTGEEIPGTAALNVGTPGGEINSVSCAAAGDCGAGGLYTDASGHWQAFVVNQTNGTWGTAEEVPGTAALNAGGRAQIHSVSCSSAGNCSAGGSYASSSTDGVPTYQAFVVSETNGTWGKAKEVRGTASLNAGGYAEINSVSCSSAGNCVAGGDYTNGSAATEAFTVSEINGTWSTAKEVPGIAALNTNGLAQISSLSCPTAGNCSATGFYEDASFNDQAFVVSQTGGAWSTAEEVPGFAALDVGSPGGEANSVSCGAPGDCSAGGYYSDASGLLQAFVVSESGGDWGTAEEAPGTAALNTGGVASIVSVSCSATGRCSAGGHFTKIRKSLYPQEAFVVSETSSG